MSVSIRIEGGEQLAANLSQLTKRMSKQILKAALVKAAEPMRSGMASRAPREPGAPDIADNIVIDPGRGRGISIAVGPSKEFPYGFYQEFGTVHHSAQPFARPAFDADGPKAIPIMTGEIWRALIRGGFAGTRGGGGGSGL